MRTWHGIACGWIGFAGRWRGKIGSIGRFACVSCGLMLGLGQAAPATAQGVGITSLNVRQYLPGGQTPVTAPFNVPVSAVTCNQPAPALGSPPFSKIVWDDPVNAGMACVYQDPGTGPLFAKIYGVIDVTLTNLAGALEGPESNRASFQRPPLAPTAVKGAR